MGADAVVTAPAPHTEAPVSRRPVIILCLLAAGVLAARWIEATSPWPWLALAGAAGAAVVLVRRGRFVPPRLQPIVLGAALAALSAGWTILRDHRVSADSLAAMTTSSEHLWRLEGRITSDPTVKTPGRGSLGRYGFQQPITVFRFEVDAAVDVGDRRVSMTGRALVRVNGPAHHWQVGDRLRLTGMLRAFPPAMNPGETDLSRIARTQNLAGILDVASVEGAIELSGEYDWLWRLRRVQDDWRQRAAGWIRQDLPETEETRRDALLAALMLGERGPGLDGLDKSFTRVGLAHLLAISGMHLAILVMTGLMVVRLFSWPPVVERLVIALLVIAYLVIVPARVPAWRAGLMALTYLLGGLAGRRLDHLNLWAFSAIVVLVWKPSEIVSPGAQLSFGVVLAFITLTPQLRRRMFGEPRDAELLSPADDLFEQGKTIVSATLVAWFVATPLVAHHFGVICPLAPLATLPAMALTHVALAAGYLKALTAVVYPSVGVLLGPVLAIAADGLIGLVDRVDRLPLSSLPVGHPGAAWTIMATSVVVWWIRSPMRTAFAPVWRRWAPAAAAIILFAWLLRSYLPAWLDPSPQRSRLIMLAVGNGSCYIVETGGEAVMFDAGSGNHLGIGETTIVPALRRLRLLSVPTLALSHGDVDHFAAAVEVMSEMNTRRLLVTTDMLRQAETDPLGPVAHVLGEAERLGVRVAAADAGHTAHFGGATWTWLHPMPHATYRNSNEASMVIRVETGRHRILLTGDVQGAGLVELMQRESPETLRASIIELPHHGSWSEIAAEFVRIVDPQIVLQSTAGARMVGDRWEAELESRQRYVTAVHGATIVDLHADGSTRVRTHRPGR